MKLIVVTGMPGAGKEEFLQVGAGLDIPFFRMGDVVREAYAASDSNDKGMSVGEFAGNERKLHGTDIWAKRVMAKAEGNSLALIDGCRSLDEIAEFRNLGADIIVVGIHASPSVRFERLKLRGRDDAPKDEQEFQARDTRELSWGLGNVLALSNFMIDNMSSLDEFRQESEILLRALR